MSLRRASNPKPVEKTKAEPQVAIEPQNTMYLHPANSHQASQSPASVAPKAPYRPHQPSFPFGMGILKELRESRSNPYIDQHVQEALHIRCEELDIDSSAANGGKHFQLLPAEHMKTFAQEHKFHEVANVGAFGASRKFSTAFGFIDLLVGCIVPPYNNQDLSERLGWHLRYPDEFEKNKLWYYLPTEAAFQLAKILEPVGGLLPHITCLLADGRLHMEDSLLFSEAWCMLMLTILALRFPRNEKHNIVPITIVSICDWQYRIVQGFVDGEKGVTNIWKSHILHFKQGKFQEDFEHILRWLLAAPIGDTTKAP